MSKFINWDLIQELYRWEKSDSDYWIQEMMTEKTLSEMGWTDTREPTSSEYKKMWALSIQVARLKDDTGMNEKLQWGYDLIDKHLGQR